MLVPSTQSAIEATLLAQWHQPTQILEAQYLHGGDINEVVLLATNRGQLVAKLKSHCRFSDFFEAEAKGLELLRAPNVLRIPEVIATGWDGTTAFLLLEYLPSGTRQPDFWKGFGRNLAKLHRSTNERFGLDHNNYIGPLEQANNWHDSWVDFFVTQRLEPQLRYGREAHWLSEHGTYEFQRLFHKLEELFPPEPPALLHGDLWSGNYLVGPNDEPCLIDPAVYFGHREIDLGMMQLFGGFQAIMYDTYNEEFPLATDWRERTPITQLYPLMVHANLFGGGYGAQVQSIVKRFV